MSYLAIGLSVFLMARGLHRGDATAAEGGAALLMMSAATAVMERIA